MDRVIKLDNVDHYNSLYGLETLHPLVSVVDLTKATKSVNHIQMTYGLYALFLKGAKNCDIKYGRQHYDYQEGTIVCFAPGQTAGVEMLNDVVQQESVRHPLSSRPDSWNLPRKDNKGLYFLLLFSKRGFAPVRSGKRDCDGLPEKDQHRAGASYR